MSLPEHVVSPARPHFVCLQVSQILEAAGMPDAQKLTLRQVQDLIAEGQQLGLRSGVLDQLETALQKHIAWEAQLKQVWNSKCKHKGASGNNSLLQSTRL